MRPIVLSVKRGRFRCDDSRSDPSDKAFGAVRPEILKRDNHTCKFCDFQAKKFQEVHHIDDNHHNNSPENLVTTCALCHSCFHIGFAGQNSAGTIIYMDPAAGLTQGSLNSIVRSLWIAESGRDQALRIAAVNMLARLYRQNVAADRMLGSSNPVILGDFLLQMSEADYLRRARSLQGFYFLPLKTGYAEQLHYWTSTTYKSRPPESWLNITNQLTGRWAEAQFGSSSAAHVLALMK